MAGAFTGRDEKPRVDEVIATFKGKEKTVTLDNDGYIKINGMVITNVPELIDLLNKAMKAQKDMMKDYEVDRRGFLKKKK